MREPLWMAGTLLSWGFLAVPGTTHLVVHQQLYGVVPPLDQHYLVGLPWDPVREGGPDSRPGARLEPHADGERIHLRQAALDAAVQVVCAQRERDLEILRGFQSEVTCRQPNGLYYPLASAVWNHTCLKSHVSVGCCTGDSSQTSLSIHWLIFLLIEPQLQILVSCQHSDNGI